MIFMCCLYLKKGHKTGYEYSTEVFKREPPPSPTKTTKAKTPAKASSFRYEQQDRDRNPVRRAHTTGRGYNRYTYTGIFMSNEKC